MSYSIKMQKNGKITLPKSVIQKLGLKPGDTVSFVAIRLRGEKCFYVTTPMSELIRLIKPNQELIPH